MGDHVETTIPLGSGLQNAIALDYDYNHNCIYWADISLDTIKRSFLNGSGMLMYQINVLLCETPDKHLMIVNDTCSTFRSRRNHFFANYHQHMQCHTG